MKNSLKANLLSYIVIRIFLSTTIACTILIGAYLATSDVTAVLLIGIPVIVITCLYTSVIIARRTKELVDEPLSKVIQFANILREASNALIETAETLNQKADVIQNTADMLDDVIDSNNIKQENKTV